MSAPSVARAPGVLVTTRAGVVRGRVEGPVSVFRGVPYARAPVGALRFAAPRAPEPWAGIRDADRFGPVFVQDVAAPDAERTPCGEDALTANVWTPGLTGRRPVLVYVHGGAWKVGAGSLPAYDGARLAEHGDLVVITFNYRLGGLGWGRHEDLADPDTGHDANWGLQDQVALLEWVHEHAAVFGGDPDAVTVCGTSAGGTSTWQLAGLPGTRERIARIIPVSACHAWAPAIAQTPDESAATYEAVAAELGTSVPGLREVEVEAFRRAWDGQFSAPLAGRRWRTGREYRGPVVDGRLITGTDHERPVPDLPALIVHTRTEGSFFTGPESPTPTRAPTTDAELVDAVRDVLRKGRGDVDDATAARCVEVYRAAADDDGRPADPVSLWTEVWGDALFRHGLWRLAERHAVESTAPTYLVEFAHPARPPFFGTPHELVAPFVFGTYAEPGLRERCGDGPREEKVSATMIDVVSSFAHTGVPGAAAADPWRPFVPGTGSVAVVGDGAPHQGPGGKLDQLRFWDALRACA